MDPVTLIVKFILIPGSFIAYAGSLGMLLWLALGRAFESSGDNGKAQKIAPLLILLSICLPFLLPSHTVRQLYFG